jgi:hypothetical protein
MSSATAHFQDAGRVAGSDEPGDEFGQDLPTRDVPPMGRIMFGHPVIDISIHVEASPPRTAFAAADQPMI